MIKSLIVQNVNETGFQLNVSRWPNHKNFMRYWSINSTYLEYRFNCKVDHYDW